MAGQHVRVGALDVPLSEAAGWVTAYFDADSNVKSKEPYAYPAYDDFTAGSGPDELNDGDLLSPVLLNVRASIEAFHGLQAIRENLQVGLARTPPAVTLGAAVEDGSLRDRLDGFVGVLDSNPTRGVKLTTLTKILHRKRPMFLPLHDQFVAACYLGGLPRHPMKRARARTWVEYWTQMCTAIHGDLADRPSGWEKLGALTPRPVSPLRLLDVVAWHAGKAPAKYE